jgi:hypothetical protein
LDSLRDLSFIIRDSPVRAVSCSLLVFLPATAFPEGMPVVEGGPILLRRVRMQRDSSPWDWWDLRVESESLP